MHRELMTDKPPDYIQRIAGVRSWQVAPNLWARMSGVLWSHALLHPWPDRKEMIAGCERGHAPPFRGCSCGIYAAANPNILAKLAYMPTDYTCIAGVVGATGAFVPAPYGWRAASVRVYAIFDDGMELPPRVIDEIAARQALVSPNSDPEVLAQVGPPTREEVAKILNVPLITHDEFEDYCDCIGLIRLSEGR